MSQNLGLCNVCQTDFNVPKLFRRKCQVREQNVQNQGLETALSSQTAQIISMQKTIHDLIQENEELSLKNNVHESKDVSMQEFIKRFQDHFVQYNVEVNRLTDCNISQNKIIHDLRQENEELSLKNNVHESKDVSMQELIKRFQGQFMQYNVEVNRFTDCNISQNKIINALIQENEELSLKNNLYESRDVR
jgi:nitrous oxidase accessory protein NosD